jgi:hypothetical protein
MDASFLDDLLLEVPEPAGSYNVAAILPQCRPADVVTRYDAFLQHRDRSCRNMVGLLYSWPTPATMLYDWYQTEGGMTVSLEALSTISRVRSGLITLRVRPVDANLDSNICKLGRTHTLPFADEELLRQVRHAITDAIDAGESPLWRLRSVLELPAFITEALEAPMQNGQGIGHLDKGITAALVQFDLVSQIDLLAWLGTCHSSYRPWRRAG